MVKNPVFQKVHFWNLHATGNFWTQFFSRTKLVRGPVFPRISQFLTFNLFYHLYVYTTMRYVGFLGPSIFPDAGIRIYGQKSGFPKSAFLPDPQTLFEENRVYVQFCHGMMIFHFF